jgi:hypothetical protein
MSWSSAKSVFIAILSLFTLGAALSIGSVKAEGVTEDQILKALSPEKKPLTRGLSMGAPAQTKPKDPANPLSEVNRRVQVVNTENKATASK